MNDLRNALWIEFHKAIRSKVPLFTGLGILILPLAGAFMMFVYKYPDFARNIGLISAKANLAGGSADWPSYLDMITEGMAIAGILLFSLIESWVFGREFSDGTVKDLLAVPVARATLLLAKFILVGVWSVTLTVIATAACLLIGAIIGLPQGTAAVFSHGTTILAVSAGLVILDVFPIAFFASVGRGYLLPMGVAMIFLILANLAAIAGWGSYFPWSIPALYAGFAGKAATPEPGSYWIVILTALAGMFATYLWWQYADQNR